MNFIDWHSKKLVVGRYPDEKFILKKYDVVINVSDELRFDIEKMIKRKVCDTYWFPMNEKKRDIGLNSIYAAMVVLYESEKQNKKVYLHSHAGLNRSVTVACAYYYMRTGTHKEQSRNGYINPLIANCSRGYLPPKAEMESFLNIIQETIKKNVLYLGLDYCKFQSIKNF